MKLMTICMHTITHALHVHIRTYNVRIYYTASNDTHVHHPTCDPVSTQCSCWPVVLFQKRIVLSAVPPPDTSRLWYCGDHASAFTAATWSENLCTGCEEELFHMKTLLSLPPEASSWLSWDHLKPQTSYK